MEFEMKLIEKLQHKYALTTKGAKDLAWSSITCAIMNIIMMLPIGLLYIMVSELVEGGIKNNWLYVIGAAVCIVIIAVTEYVKYNAQYTSVYIESGRRRISLGEKLRKLPLSFFAKKDLSDLTSSIMADCATLETGTSHWVPELIGSVMSTMLISVSILLFDWRMGIAAVWVVPFAFADVFFSRKIQQKILWKSNAKKMELADSIQESLEGFQDLKANNAESEYMQKLHRDIYDVERFSMKSEVLMAYFVVSGQIILKLGIPTIAIVGASLLISGEISLLTFFMFLLVASRLYDPLAGSLINLGGTISLGIQGERLDAILNHKIQTGESELTNKGFDIQFDKVCFAYETGEPVLNEVSFTAKQGEVTALIGASGCGKTTITRLAARFWDINSGQIKVGGMDIAKIDPETLLSLYSVVFQDVTLFNNTVMENIRIGRKDATDEEVIEAGRLAHVDVFAETMPNGWNTMIGENGGELSGGERQRISIARAFLKKAPIILMDEATASLDVENETFVQESLSRLIKDKTVIIIAHRMRTVAGADKIVVLNNGSVEQEGTPSEMIEKEGFYSRMLKLQQASADWQLQ